MKAFTLYKRMFSYLTVYWYWIILSLFLSLLVVNFEALSLWFGATLVQALFLPTSTVLTRPTFSISNINEILKYYTWILIRRETPIDSLKSVCLLMASTFLIKNILIYCKAIVMNLLNLNLIRDLRNQLYSHLMKLPVSFFALSRSGNIISILMNDTATINNALTSSFDKIFVEPIRVVFFITMLFIISFKLTLMIFIIFPMVGLMIVYVGKTVRRRSRRALEYIGGLHSILHDTINGIRTVKIFSMEDKEKERFSKENNKYIHHSFRASVASALSSPLTEVLGVLVIIILLWYGGHFVLVAKKFGAEDFVRFLVFLFSTFTPLKSLTTINNTIQTGLAAAGRVFEVLDRKEENIIFASRNKKIYSFNDKIEFSHVFFTYPGKKEPVLKDISFTVKKGSVVAIVGSSGAGKTTILDLLPRFYEIDSGVISIDGIDIREIELSSLRSLFGIVAQETFLFNDTIYNNIAYGYPNATYEIVYEAAKVANAIEFIEKLPDGFNTVIGERGVMLSGGQRQRLSIARALLRNPPILIFDEATSALDTESEIMVQTAINNMITNHNALVVAHRLSTIRKADFIIVLEKGEIVEQGTHDELIDKGERYKYFYDLQFSTTEQLKG